MGRALGGSRLLTEIQHECAVSIHTILVSGQGHVHSVPLAPLPSVVSLILWQCPGCTKMKMLALGKRPFSQLCPPLLWNDSPQKQTTEVNLAEAKSTFCCRVSRLSKAIQIRDGQDARAHRSVSVRTELDGSCVPIWHCPSVPCQRGTGENAYSVGGGVDNRQSAFSLSLSGSMHCGKASVYHRTTKLYLLNCGVSASFLFL